MFFCRVLLVHSLTPQNYPLFDRMSERVQTANECDFVHVMWCDGWVLKAGGDRVLDRCNNNILHVAMLQGMYQNDFLGLSFKNFVLHGVSTGPPISGEYVVEQLYQIETGRGKWADLGVVLGMVVGYRLIFFAMIKATENMGPRLRSFLRNPLQFSTCCLLFCRPAGPAEQNTVRPLSTQPSPQSSPMHETVPLRHQHGSIRHPQHHHISTHFTS